MDRVQIRHFEDAAPPTPDGNIEKFRLFGYQDGQEAGVPLPHDNPNSHHAQRPSRQLTLSCASIRSTMLPPTGRSFFVIGWPEHFLLMRSTSAASRLAPTPPRFPVRMTSPGSKGTVDLELRP
jgi:hypothetical protein